MKYTWQRTAIAGLLALRDDDGTLIAALKGQGEFTMAFMAAPQNGPVLFDAIPDARLALLGMYPTAQAASRAVQNEVQLYLKFGRFPNIIRT